MEADRSWLSFESVLSVLARTLVRLLLERAPLGRRELFKELELEEIGTANEDRKASW